MEFVAYSTSGDALPSRQTEQVDIETVRTAFPHLEVIELIGRGGMGAVYKAKQKKLDRFVALKILPTALAKEPAFADRFEREGRLLAKLNHPNIVSVFDFGLQDGLYYLIMEYVDGVNLRQAYASSKFSQSQALSIIPKICEALQVAHDEGVLHRDIKPENILLSTKGTVKIADFGIAKLSSVDDHTGLTATGASIGTPHYMAPEQVEKPGEVDHRADIYSLGVVFYEMLTGELPLGRFSPPSERSVVDSRLDKVVLRALEKDREKRQQSAAQVRTEVEYVSKNEPSPVAAFANSPQSFLTKPIWYTRAVVSTILSVSGFILCWITIIAEGSLEKNLEFQYLLLFSGLLGLPGTILGIAHFHYIRKSGNSSGLKTAFLGATLWPVVAVILYLVVPVIYFFRETFSTVPGKFFAIILWSIAIVVCIALMRLAYQWANNKSVVDKGFTGKYNQRLVWKPYMFFSILLIGLIVVGVRLGELESNAAKRREQVRSGGLGVIIDYSGETKFFISECVALQNVLFIRLASDQLPCNVQVSYFINGSLSAKAAVEAENTVAKLMNGKSFALLFQNEPAKLVRFSTVHSAYWIGIAMESSDEALACKHRLERHGIPLKADKLDLSRSTIGLSNQSYLQFSRLADSAITYANAYDVPFVDLSKEKILGENSESKDISADSSMEESQPSKSQSSMSNEL